MARVLIADDNEQIRRLLRCFLQREGHEIHEAADGVEAVKACRRGDFDLLVCDLYMPNKEGLETIRELRRDFPRMKIIAVSGGSHCGIGVECLRPARLLGADLALSKPFRPPDLLNAITAVLAPQGDGAAQPAAR